jgi:hypothetical protein
MLGYSSDTVPSPRKSMVKATTLGRQNKVRQDLLPDRESLSSLSAKKISDYSLSVVSLAEPPSDPLVNLHYQDDADRNAQDQQPLEDGERYGAEHPLKRRRINDRYLRKPEAYGRVRRAAIALNGSFFNTQRMVSQYITNGYLPDNRRT